MFRHHILATGLLIASSTVIAGGVPCTLANLPINPAQPGKTDVFVGRSGDVEVQFVNYRPTEDVEVFPEPPLTIRNNRTGDSCSVEGGVWARKSAYISDDNAVLVTYEFSGSNDSLNFYSTNNCKKLRALDVSNSTWEIGGSRITVVKHLASGGRIRDRRIEYGLDTNCRPTASSRETRRVEKPVTEK